MAVEWAFEISPNRVLVWTVPCTARKSRFLTSDGQSSPVRYRPNTHINPVIVACGAFHLNGSTCADEVCSAVSLVLPPLCSGICLNVCTVARQVPPRKRSKSHYHITGSSYFYVYIMRLVHFYATQASGSLQAVKYFLTTRILRRTQVRIVGLISCPGGERKKLHLLSLLVKLVTCASTMTSELCCVWTKRRLISSTVV